MYVLSLCFHDGCELTTPDPSALILGVKFCDQETGTNLHTQERTTDLNAPAAHHHFSFLSCSGWHHLSCSPVMFSFLSCSLWRHIYHTQAGTCVHVHLFSDDAWQTKRTDTRTWRDTSTSSTHHHDESLLLRWM